MRQRRRRRVESSRVKSSCVASCRIALLQVAGHRDAFSRRRIPPSLSVPTLSAAQHRRWNPRRNFRFRRGSRALAEPKDDRSASEIVRDNSPPCGFLFSSPSLSLSSSLCYFTLPYPYLLLPPCIFLFLSTFKVYLFVFPSILVSNISANLLRSDDDIIQDNIVPRWISLFLKNCFDDTRNE